MDKGQDVIPPFQRAAKPLRKEMIAELVRKYLEHALKEVRHKLPRLTTRFEAEILDQIAYTDDIDFIEQDCADIKKIQE